MLQKFKPLTIFNICKVFKIQLSQENFATILEKKWLKKFVFLFRDNGITIQISIYQIYSEIFMFLILLIFIPITKFGPKTENWTRIFGIFTSIMCFVIRPIFLLFGDVNFRKRVLDQGIWKALEKELFSNNAEIQPVN